MNLLSALSVPVMGLAGNIVYRSITNLEDCEVASHDR